MCTQRDHIQHWQLSNYVVRKYTSTMITEITTYLFCVLSDLRVALIKTNNLEGLFNLNMNALLREK